MVVGVGGVFGGGGYWSENLILLMKFPVLEKFVDLMKDLKFEHQRIFPLWGEGQT